MEIQNATLEQVNDLFQQKKLERAFRLSNEDYHAAPGLSKSVLDDIRISPAHYKWKRKNPLKLTEALIVGSAYHETILETEPFDDLFYITKTQPRVPKLDEHGRSPLAERHLDNIKGMREALFNTDLGPKVIDGLREVSFFWTDEQSGVLCKVKPDVLLPNGTVVDLKSTTDASRDSFSKAIWDRSYAMQGAFIVDGIRALFLKTNTPPNFTLPDKFLLVAQEKTAPYFTSFYDLGPRSMVIGEQQYREALELYVDCEMNIEEGKEWPGYTKGIEEIEVPGWALARYG
jgi:hypothetical protein